MYNVYVCMCVSSWFVRCCLSFLPEPQVQTTTFALALIERSHEQQCRRLHPKWATQWYGGGHARVRAPDLRLLPAGAPMDAIDALDVCRLDRPCHPMTSPSAIAIGETRNTCSMLSLLRESEHRFKPAKFSGRRWQRSNNRPLHRHHRHHYRSNERQRWRSSRRQQYRRRRHRS